MENWFDDHLDVLFPTDATRAPKPRHPGKPGEIKPSGPRRKPTDLRTPAHKALDKAAAIASYLPFAGEGASLAEAKNAALKGNTGSALFSLAMAAPILPGKKIAKVAARNIKKGSMTGVNLRTMTKEDALAAARRNVHLKQDPKSGQYIGAPRGIDTPGKLAAMRKAFDEQVMQGVEGGDWYPRARAGIAQVTHSPEQADLFANENALWSSQATPEVNLGFALKAHNAYEAGAPLPLVHTGAQAKKYNTARDAGKLVDNGPKTGVYENHINPNKGDAVTGTNDIWHARAFGYTDTDGRPASRGLTAQEHAFLDAETVLAADRANKRKLGGREDWDIGAVQAAPWVYGKGKDLAARRDMTLQEGVAEASKTYPDYFGKHTAFGTYEHVPGAGTGHLPKLGNMPLDWREQYSAMAPWTDEAGKDILYKSSGMYQLPTNAATGFFKGPNGLEINPAHAARPLVGLTEDAGGKAIDDASRSVMSKVEGLRAYLDAQNAGAFHKPIRGAKAGVSTSAFTPLPKPLTAEQMGAIAPVAEKHGFGLSDTGQGLTLMNFGDGPEAKGLNKVLAPSHELGGLLGALGGGQPVRTRFDGGLLDFSDPFKASNEGSGAATRQLFGLLDDPASPAVAGKLDSPEVRKKAAANASRDEAWAAATGDVVRPDIQRAREIFSKGGLPALRAALERGEILPSVILGALGLQALASRRDSSSKRDE